MAVAQADENAAGQRLRVGWEQDTYKALADCMAGAQAPAAQALAPKRVARDGELGMVMRAEFASQRGICGIAT